LTFFGIKSNKLKIKIDKIIEIRSVFVHGKSMILLGIMCTINIIMGYIFSAVSLVLFAYIDAIIKFIFGVYLLFFSKVTKQ